jgi:hypothetical protein
MSFLFDQGEAAFAKRPARLSVGEVIARAFGRRMHAHAESVSLKLADRRLGLVRLTQPPAARKPSSSPTLGS